MKTNGSIVKAGDVVFNPELGMGTVIRLNLGFEQRKGIFHCDFHGKHIDLSSAEIEKITELVVVPKPEHHRHPEKILSCLGD